MTDNGNDKILWFIIGIIAGIIIETSIILVVSNINKTGHIVFDRDQNGRITGIHYIGSHNM